MNIVYVYSSLGDHKVMLHSVQKKFTDSSLSPNQWTKKARIFAQKYILKWRQGIRKYFAEFSMDHHHCKEEVQAY